jgi:hypothetical protein
LHPQSFISLLWLLTLLLAYLYLTFAKLHFFISFSPFVLIPSSIYILNTLFIYFGCLLYSLPTFILYSRSFISLVRLLSLLPTHFHFAFSKFHCFASFAPFVPRPPPFCIFKALFLCFICSLCSIFTFILHPLSFICLLHLLFAHLHFASTKLHFSSLFASFVLFPLSICILEALFLCFGCLLMSTFILHSRYFISLLHLLPLLPTNLYFAFSKLHCFASFVPFVPCPPPFYILKASFICFICSLCSMSTFILHPQSFISLVYLLPLYSSHFQYASLKLYFSISVAYSCLLILHS